jgi:hypothetical protein
MTVLSALTIVAWPFALYMTIFLFLAPGAAVKPLSWLSAFLLISYPAVVYLGISIAKKAHEHTQTLRAIFGLFVANINFLLLFVLLKW